MKRTTQGAGKSLRDLRTIAGLTLEQVAAEAGVSASYLSKVETGEKAASPPWIGHVTRVIAKHLVDAA